MGRGDCEKGLWGFIASATSLGSSRSATASERYLPASRRSRRQGRPCKDRKKPVMWSVLRRGGGAATIDHVRLVPFHVNKSTDGSAVRFKPIPGGCYGPANWRKWAEEHGRNFLGLYSGDPRGRPPNGYFALQVVERPPLWAFLEPLPLVPQTRDVHHVTTSTASTCLRRRMHP